MKTLPTGLLLLLSLVLVPSSATAQESPLPKETSRTPASPWNLEELRKVPKVEWQESNTSRSLFYAGEPLEEKPTRVFAVYATPGTLSGVATKDKNLPGIHIGGQEACAGHRKTHQAGVADRERG